MEKVKKGGKIGKKGENGQKRSRETGVCAGAVGWGGGQILNEMHSNRWGGCDTLR
jgi:putative AlgH/UPF0301 family transcriptional regulator